MKRSWGRTAYTYWNDDKFILEVLKAFSFLALTIVVNYFAVRYAAAHAGPVVSDLLFEHTARFDTHFVDYYFALYFAAGTLLFSLLHPQFLLFFLKAIASLILARDFFMNLTELGVPTTAPTLSFFTQGGDLFFSGHTALPFMAALVFWDMRPARYLLMLLCIFMGIEVILGRQHYSIDVFAAPFITYGVYIICQKVFKSEYSMIQEYENKSPN